MTLLVNVSAACERDVFSANYWGSAADEGKPIIFLLVADSLSSSKILQNHTKYFLAVPGHNSSIIYNFESYILFVAFLKFS